MKTFTPELGSRIFGPGYMRVNENSSVVAGVISVIKLTNRDRLLPSIERVKYDENFFDILRSSRRR